MCDEEDDMQPNPRHQALKELLTSAEGMQQDIADALKKAHKVMDGGEAWAGPSTAKTFLEDLGGRKDDLPGIAERLVGDIRQELESCPKEISAPENHGGNIPI